MAQLPQELSIEIMSWLPVKSLLRFRCVSKPICRVIDSSDFINWHLNRSFQNLNLRKLIFEDRSCKKFQVSDVNLDLEEEILHLERPISSFWKKVYGYCKGLLLLKRTEFRIALSNPSIRQCRDLLSSPKFGLALWNPSTRHCRDLPNFPFAVQCIIGSGLGYDESTDDFVALSMVYAQLNIEVEFKIEIQVWIYRLKSNIWRKTKNFPYLVYKMGSVQGVPEMGYFSTYGSLHWLLNLFRNNKWQLEIVAFDIRKETFSIVSQPFCPINLMEVVLIKLHVLEDCLCISYFSCSMLPEAYLYIRENDGFDMFTWRELYSVTDS